MSKKQRRALLLILTLVALLMAISGVLLDSFLENNPVRLATFWLSCLMLVCLIFIVAIIDIRSLRKEFKTKQAELDDQFAESLAQAHEDKDKTQ